MQFSLFSLSCTCYKIANKYSKVGYIEKAWQHIPSPRQLASTRSSRIMFIMTRVFSNIVFFTSLIFLILLTRSQTNSYFQMTQLYNYVPLKKHPQTWRFPVVPFPAPGLHRGIRLILMRAGLQSVRSFIACPRNHQKVSPFSCTLQYFRLQAKLR